MRSPWTIAVLAFRRDTSIASSDRFFTYRPGHRREHHVGLGLAIAKQIVEGYNGVITASNRADGGARFEVSPAERGQRGQISIF